jgi:signal transduction histidine kinase/ligand-binding sensor domain-containing protein
MILSFKKFRRLWCFLASVTITLGGSISPLFSQEYITNIQHYSVDDGMYEAGVIQILQDEKKYVWAISRNSLNRFDGKNFKVFHTINSDLPKGEIEYVKKDKNGWFWLQFFDENLVAFDPLNFVFHTPNALLNIKDGRKIQLVKNSFLPEALFGIDENGNLLDLYSGRIEVNLDQPKFQCEFKNADYLVITPWKTLFCFNDEEMVEYDFEGNILSTNYLEGKRWFYSFDIVDGELYIFYRYAIRSNVKNAIKVIKEGGKLEPFFFEKTKMTSRLEFGQWRLANDELGRYWISKESNLFVYDKYGCLLKNFDEDIKNEIGTLSNIIDLWIDQFSQLWIATASNGILKVSMEHNQFDHFLKTVPSTSIRGIIQLDSHQMMAATYSGGKIFSTSPKAYQVKCPKIKMSIRSTQDYGICKDGQNFWLGSHSKRVKKLNFNECTEVDYIFTQDSVNVPKLFFPFYNRSTKTTIIGSDKGLYYFDTTTLTIRSYHLDNEFENLLTVQPVLQKSDGVWLATNIGLLFFDKNHQVSKVYQDEVFRNVVHIYEDEHGIFWLATRGSGLIKWNQKNNQIRKFTTLEGLSHNIIYAVYEDDFQNLWIPSNNGIMRFNKNSEEIITYYEEDGITNNEFNNISHYKAADGRLFFGSVNGITAFYPNEIIGKLDLHAPLVINNIFIQNSETGVLELNNSLFEETNKIRIEPNQTNFRIDFSLLDYRNPNAIVYAWKIDELDEDWYLQKENTIRVNRLPYGNFTLRIKGKMSGGNWSEQEISIPIEVIRPFYLKNWFIASVILSFIGFFFLVFQWRISQVEKDRKRLENLVEERTKELAIKATELEGLNRTKDRFFALIAHDLRSPLITLGSLAKKVNFLISKDRLSEVQILGSTVENAVDSVHKLLDNLLKWALIQRNHFPYRPEFVQVKAVVNDVLGIYENIAETKEIELDAQISKNLKIFVDKNAIETVIRNITDNALKYTSKGGKVTITADQSNGKVCIKIKDTGIGMSEHEIESLFDLKAQKGNVGTGGEQGTGLGLVLCNDLIKMNKGDLKVHSESEKGTVFSIYLPSKIQKN